MSDVGLRMMGKDPEGDARGVEVTDQGAVKTQVTGSIVKLAEENTGFTISPGDSYDVLPRGTEITTDVMRGVIRRASGGAGISAAKIEISWMSGESGSLSFTQEFDVIRNGNTSLGRTPDIKNLSGYIYDFKIINTSSEDLNIQGFTFIGGGGSVSEGINDLSLEEIKENTKKASEFGQTMLYSDNVSADAQSSTTVNTGIDVEGMKYIYVVVRIESNHNFDLRAFWRINDHAGIGATVSPELQLITHDVENDGPYENIATQYTELRGTHFRPVIHNFSDSTKQYDVYVFGVR